MRTATDIDGLVRAELIRIADSNVRDAISRLLVTPRCEDRGWDYGPSLSTYPCWIVLEHRASGTAIAYCEHGFGPRCPWGLIWLDGGSMGMDSAWFKSLEDAFHESWASEDRPRLENRS